MQIDRRKLTFAMWVIAVVSVSFTGGCDSNDTPVVQDTSAVQESAAVAEEGGSPREHVAVTDGYTLRASAVPSDTLPPEMLAEHEIEGGADRGVLNVVVLKQGPDGQDDTVAADVTAQQSNLMDQSREIEMRAVTANDGTSYLGTFEYSPQDFFRFTITAQPAGTDEVLTVEFEERSAVLR